MTFLIWYNFALSVICGLSAFLGRKSGWSRTKGFPEPITAEGLRRAHQRGGDEMAVAFLMVLSVGFLVAFALCVGLREVL